MSASLGPSHAIVAVLAGGRGTRLGGEKAVAQLGGRPMIAHVLAAAREAELQAVVIAKRETVLPELQREPILEGDEPHHPLCGVLAALDHAQSLSPSTGVVLVGCDMPFLPAAVLRLLADLDGAAILEIDSRLQPLPSRCMPEHRPALGAALDSEMSLRAALTGLQPEVVAESALRRFGTPECMCASINRPDQLAQAERCLDADGGRS